MVSRTDKLAARVGGLMLWGAFVGVGIALVSVTWLTLAGRPLMPWPLILSGWWAGEDWLLELTAGVGLLLLAGTPVAALVVLGGYAARSGRWRSLVAALGLGLVLTVGLVLAARGI